MSGGTLKQTINGKSHPWGESSSFIGCNMSGGALKLRLQLGESSANTVF